MLLAVHHQTIIDLIRKDNQLMASRNLHDALQQILRIQRTGWVIRVDDNDTLGAIRDLALDIVQIRHPFRFLITDIVNRMTAGQIRSGCPQRVIRRRNQDLIPVIQKALHRHRDHLADAVANINIIHTDIRNPLQLAVLHDRLAGTEDSL